MQNLLQETIRDIRNNGLSPDGIVYIGSDPHLPGPFYSCSWQEFEKLADFDYDNGFGTKEIAADLTIIFHDGSFMVREEYDGSEWWEVYRPYRWLPQFTLPIKQLKGNRWTLAEINEIADCAAEG